MVSTDCLYLHYHLDEIATKVAYDCTVIKADCKAVIEALIHEMNNQLLNSYSVKLDGSGLSKLPSNQGGYRGIRVLSAINIYSWAVKILPAYGVDAVGVRTASLLSNCKVAETPKYDLP